MLIKFSVCVCVLVLVSASQQQGCTEQRTCADCIQTPGCVWCSRFNTTQVGQQRDDDDDEDDDNSVVSEMMMYHCQDHSVDLTSLCASGHLENPLNQATITTDHPLTDINHKATTDNSNNIIQLSPQRMKLRLRKGVPQNLTINYRLATDYPVDLYYLMDLSKSMEDDKNNVAEVGYDLAKLLSSLTTQYRLGFGSFVDKVLMPFSDTSPTKIDNPCEGCAAPYAFKNHLSLSDGYQLFKSSVSGAQISGNMDSPEGGFDALMQAMVCQDIGWRQQARKIIVFSTDDKFHYAGDGKLAGIIRPNDEKCHLIDNMYTDYDKYDYPSIAQIDKVAKERQINIIFAVTGHEDLYEKLHELIETSSYGLLSEGSSNVVHLVQDQYQKLSSVVRLSDNSSSELRMEYSVQCETNGTLQHNTDSCSEVQPGNNITFYLNVTAKECPMDGETRYIEVNTLQDKLVLEIDFVCSCSCDTVSQNIPRSGNCSGNGTMVCGVCHCEDQYRGEKCQCRSDDTETSESVQDATRCKADPDKDEVCSGQGYCSCGMCVCRDPDIHGTYCNCNRLKCQSGLGIECSGHGTCDCNECMCHQGYTGHHCECKDSTACIPSGQTEECSGHGECVCGKCKCRQENGVLYTGRYCEDCPSCSSGRCFEFRDCVQCQHFSSGPLSQHSLCHTCNITSNIIDSLKGQQTRGASLCNFEDDDGCYFFFTYRYNNRLSPGDDTPLYDIYVQRQKQCPPPPPVLAISFGLVAGIVAIGVLTLIIWKIVTTIHDRREYEKFQQESQNAQWATEDNRLYVAPVTTNQNPAYNNQNI